MSSEAGTRPKLRSQVTFSESSSAGQAGKPQGRQTDVHRTEGRDRDREKYSGEREKYSGDREKYSGEREKYSSDRDKYSSDRDKYSGRNDAGRSSDQREKHTQRESKEQRQREHEHDGVKQDSDRRRKSDESRDQRRSIDEDRSHRPTREDKREDKREDRRDEKIRRSKEEERDPRSNTGIEDADYRLTSQTSRGDTRHKYSTQTSSRREESKEPRDARDSRDSREARDRRHTREGQDSRQTREKRRDDRDYSKYDKKDVESNRERRDHNPRERSSRDQDPYDDSRAPISQTRGPEYSQNFSKAGDAHMPLNESVEALSISQAVPDQQVIATPPPKSAAKKKFASKMRSIVTAVKTAQLLEKSRHSATSATFVPKYAKEDIVRSGHIEYDTLYASNEREVLYAAANNYAAGNYAASNILSQTGDMTVNSLNAPNESTLQCGCENINCPFCNLMMSLGSTDPDLLQ